MITLTPIHERDGDRHYQEFFRPEYLSERLGRSGQWLGGGVAKLELSGPVQRDAFAQLLQGRTPDGEKLLKQSWEQGERVLGWRINVTAEGPLNPLWALSSGALRTHLQTGFAKAAQAVVTDFERRLNGVLPWGNAYARGRQSVLCGEFQSGASPAQTPRLESTLFLFNLQFQRGMENTVLRPEFVNARMPRMHDLFSRVATDAMKQTVGGRIEFPKQMIQRFQEESPLHSDRPGDARWKQALRGQDLFDAWHNQARRWGWSTRDTLRVIDRAQPTVSSFMQDCKNLGRLWTLWATQSEHSSQRVREALIGGRANDPTAQATSHDNDMSMSQ